MTPSIPLLTGLIVLDTIVVATTAILTLLTTATVPLGINRIAANDLLVKILVLLPPYPLIRL